MSWLEFPQSDTNIYKINNTTSNHGDFFDLQPNTYINYQNWLYITNLSTAYFLIIKNFQILHYGLTLVFL